MYIYIYIYRERERYRERHIYIYIYMHIYIYIYTHPPPTKCTCCMWHRPARRLGPLSTIDGDSKSSVAQPYWISMDFQLMLIGASFPDAIACPVSLYICSFIWRSLCALCIFIPLPLRSVFVLRLISLITLRLLRLLESNFPGNSLWAWEFHPLKLRLCLSQTL